MGRICILGERESVNDDGWKEKYVSLVQQLRADGGQGIFPQGHLTDQQREDFKNEHNDAYQTGWNDAVLERVLQVGRIVKHAEDGLSDDLTMLLTSDCCFLSDEGELQLNMNDTWGWALAWCPTVPADEVKEVARLFRLYGNAGLMYWHSCKEDNMRSEFHDNNRAIDFVRHEEQYRKEIPDSSKRAYTRIQYTIG